MTPEEIKQYQKKWYAEHRDQKIEATKKWYSENREYMKNWYTEHREQKLEAMKQWHASPHASIYEITNLITGKKYIGSTIMNPRARWLKHIYGIKEYPHLQLYRDMLKYGKEKFKFEVLFKCPKDQARIAEQFVMDAYNGELYNKRKARRNNV